MTKIKVCYSFNRSTIEKINEKIKDIEKISQKNLEFTNIDNKSKFVEKLIQAGFYQIGV